MTIKRNTKYKSSYFFGNLNIRKNKIEFDKLLSSLLKEKSLDTGSDEILMQLNDADKPTPVIGTPRPTNSIIHPTHPFSLRNKASIPKSSSDGVKSLKLSSLKLFKYIGSDFIIISKRILASISNNIYPKLFSNKSKTIFVPKYLYSNKLLYFTITAKKNLY